MNRKNHLKSTFEKQYSIKENIRYFWYFIIDFIPPIDKWIKEEEDSKK